MLSLRGPLMPIGVKTISFVFKISCSQFDNRQFNRLRTLYDKKRINYFILHSNTNRWRQHSRLPHVPELTRSSDRQTDRETNLRTERHLATPESALCIRSNISTVDNCKLSWSDNVRYLGIYLRSSRTFACSFSHAKKSMYRAFNAVFGKVWRTASPDVVLQLVKSKCLPALCYGVDVCPVNKSQTASLQYIRRR